MSIGNGSKTDQSAHFARIGLAQYKIKLIRLIQITVNQHMLKGPFINQSINMTTCSAIAIVLAMVSLLFRPVVAAAANDFNLPDLGEPAAAVMSELDEQQLGRRFMRRLRRSQPIVDDPVIENYINQLGNRLAQFSARPESNYTFFVVEQKTLNAFAAPGGYIGVNTGLILAAQTESELGGVLAHEISHATQKHLARLIARSKELSLPAAAAMVGAILLGGQAGTAALVATNAAVVSDRLAYTRDFEREADALGIRTLHNAGMDPRGMVNFFDRMQRWGRVQELKVPEFLRTHPLTASRIAEAKARLRQLEHHDSGINLEYQLVRERIRALFFIEPHEALAYFDAELKLLQETASSVETPTNDSNAITLRYGRALALNRLNKPVDAEKVLLALLDNELSTDSAKEVQNNSIVQRATDLVIRALVDSYTASEHFDKALATLHTLSTDGQVDDVLTQATRASIYLEQGKLQLAQSLSRRLSLDQSNNARLQKLHAQICAQAGDQSEFHEAMANYHFLNDNFGRSLDQLFAARNLTRDDYHANARVEARIKEVQRAKRLLESK